jgi:hypothetical protein
MTTKPNWVRAAGDAPEPEPAKTVPDPVRRGKSRKAAKEPKLPKAPPAQVERTAEVSASSAEAALNMPAPSPVTQERLRTYVSAKDFVERERNQLRTDLDAGAHIEAGEMSVEIEEERKREISSSAGFRALSVQYADLLVKAGVFTHVADGEAAVKEEVKKSPYKNPPYRAVKVWRNGETV